MRRRRPVTVAALGATAFLSIALVARPARARMVIDEDFFVQPTFELQGAAIGKQGAPEAAPAHLAGSTIAALDDGALVIDGDSGQLLRVDKKGKAIARLEIGADAGQLVYDAAAKRAYVSDRMGDTVVVVSVGKKLVEKQRWETPTEPWGLALTPDGKTLLVTTIADRTLIAFDAGDGDERWQVPLSREPRGVAISPDGTTAMVAYLSTGTAERIPLVGEHRGVHVALGGGRATNSFAAQPIGGFVADSVPTRSFARNAFAVRFLGNGVAVVGFQQSTPVQISEGNFQENTGSYGGGFDPPIEHRVAFVGAPEDGETPSVQARIASHQPNAIAWDADKDRMVVAGYGSDDLLVVANASQSTIALERHVSLAGDTPCGPDGVAISDGTAWVWCSLSRQVATVDLAAGSVARAKPATKSRRSDLERAGLALFRAGNDGRISTRGAMACSSCHPDGRADGLSWRIEKHELQTPVLSGRVAGTHPYKWDGGDKDLVTSLTGTMRRLGGSGLGDTEVKQLSAYLESIPAPRVPARDTKQVARGKKLFTGELGCNTCHSGKRLTDRERHELGGNLEKADTPSLIGLASSAPYYHDGSAATLDALLRDTGLVHGMADLGDLDEQQISPTSPRTSRRCSGGGTVPESGRRTAALRAGHLGVPLAR